jgi:hypothetical protein
MMAARFSDVLCWLGLLLGGGIWITVLALAHSAGPIDQAVFWASLIASLPIGFGWMCRCILSGKTAPDGSDEPRGCSPTSSGHGSNDRAARGPVQRRAQSGSRMIPIFDPGAPSITPYRRGSGQGYIIRQKESAAVSLAVKARPACKLHRKSTRAVAKAKNGPVTKVIAKQPQGLRPPRSAKLNVPLQERSIARRHALRLRTRTTSRVH